MKTEPTTSSRRKTKRCARLSMRLTEADKQVIERAAQVLGMDITEFVVEAALQKAQQMHGPDFSPAQAGLPC